MVDYARKGQLGVCFFSSYPPRECGIATFTVALKKAVEKKLSDIELKIIAIEEPGQKYDYSGRVIKVVKRDRPEDYREAARIINSDSSIDIVCLQHVFSLFGGKDGELILDFLKELKKPCVTTMHMVYSPDKDPHDFEIVETNHTKITKEIIKYSAKLVVMIQPVADLLVYKYGVPEDKVLVIPHGLPNVVRQDARRYKDKLGFPEKRIISTFGLIRQKKGLEYVLYAMPEILKKYPNAVYLILGESHPTRPRDYYEFLQGEVKRLRIEQNVIFYEQYLTYKEIIQYLFASDVFVTPYLVPEQTSSGVVAYALGCGKAIVSSKFLYSKEVLDEGRGILVDFKNSSQIYKAIDFLFSHPGEKGEIEKRAYEYGQEMIWEEVAMKYVELFFDILKSKEEKVWLRHINQCQFKTH